MNKQIIVLVVIVVIVGAFFLLRGGGEKAVEEVPVAISFIKHVDAGMPEQDVFVAAIDDDSLVFRVEQADIDANPALLEARLFASKETAEHDPFKLGEAPFGPFEKGESLLLTLGDWLSATGEGTYLVSSDGSEAEIDFTAQNLIPNGVYTVWCSRIKMPPDPVVTDFPCGALDGSENVVTADENGNLTYTVTTEPLQASTDEEVAVIALAYHSDGETYGEEPGPFGSVTHVQIFWMMPAPSIN